MQAGRSGSWLWVWMLGKGALPAWDLFQKGLEVPRAQRTDGVGGTKGLPTLSEAVCFWNGGGRHRSSKLGQICSIQLQHTLYKSRNCFAYFCIPHWAQWSFLTQVSNLFPFPPSLFPVFLSWFFSEALFLREVLGLQQNWEESTDFPYTPCPYTLPTSVTRMTLFFKQGWAYIDVSKSPQV